MNTLNSKLRNQSKVLEILKVQKNRLIQKFRKITTFYNKI
jgi:hypothetical protein